MKNLLTGDDLFAEILMLGGQGSCVILVEGPDDMSALDAHVSEDTVMMIPGYGKTSVEYAIELSDKRRLKYVLAILDRDWVGISTNSHKSANIVYTDLYDLDATILFTGDVCKRVVYGFSDVTKVKGHLAKTTFARAIDAVVPASATIGVLRLIIQEQRLPLSVRDFPVAAVLDPHTIKIDLDQLLKIAETKAAKNNKFVDKENVKNEVAARMQAIADLKRYCSGHDLATTLATLMRTKWGSKVKLDDVPRAIRAALGCPELTHTSLYRDVEDWAVSRSLKIWTCPIVLADA